MKRPQSEPETGGVTASAEDGKDVALIHGVESDGTVHIIRRRDERLEAGALRPVKEGSPIHGELVSLKPRKHMPLLCDVKVHYQPPRQEPAQQSSRRKGPAQVATDRYRANWDSIWSSKKSEALN